MVDIPMVSLAWKSIVLCANTSFSWVCLHELSLNMQVFCVEGYLYIDWKAQ